MKVLKNLSHGTMNVMKNTKVSIIIPTYKVEEYIETCVESLVRQTSQDFDAYVISDGSPTDEKSIVLPYTKKHQNIHFIEKENGGYGSVLEYAKGLIKTPYFLICDPDDYLEDTAVEELINIAEKHDTDIVIGAKNLIYSDNHEIKYDPSISQSLPQIPVLKNLHPSDDEFKYLFFVEPSPHAKLYKTELLHSIEFPQKVSYTDNVLYFLSLLRSQNVVYTNKAYSYYLINRVGNTRTDVSINSLKSWIKVLTQLLKQAESIKDIPDVFYYRMYEAFWFVCDKAKYVNTDLNIKVEMLLEFDDYLNLLHAKKREVINVYNGLFPQLNYPKYKMFLLNRTLNTSQLTEYFTDYLSDENFTLSSKQKLKKIILNSQQLSKLYDVYHHYAKYFYARKLEKIVTHKGVSYRVIDPVGQTFYGYFNRSPYRNGHYLYHRLNSNSLDLKQSVDIVLDSEKISESTAWNWQQGSMLNWIDDTHIIHNVFKDNQYQAKLININDQSIKYFSKPIYALSHNGNFALSLNFSRLAKYRPDYGYFNLETSNIKELDINDGIFYIDLKTNESKILINFEQLIHFDPNETMKDAAHKVNHIDISPDDSKCMFYHRWLKHDKKYTRLFVYEFKSKKLELISDTEMASHCFWEDNKTIIGYLRSPEGQDGYYRIKDGKFERILDNLIDDGHPSTMSLNGLDLCITDTYPDYQTYQRLFVSKKPFKQAIELARFKSYLKFENETRCDLHPRFNQDESKLTLDTVANGKRQIIEVDFSKWLKN